MDTPENMNADKLRPMKLRRVWNFVIYTIANSRYSSAAEWFRS